MKRCWLAAIFFLLFFARSGQAQFESFNKTPVEINAESTHFESGVAVAEGNVTIQYGTATIYSDYAQYNPDTHEVLLRGNVRIYSEEREFVGERAIYNLETKQLHAANFRGDFYPFKYDAAAIESIGPKAFQAHDALFTTSDSSKPDYQLRAKTVRIYTRDHIIFSNVTLYVGSVPVFWWPYLYQNLQRDLAFTLTPGYRSSWGEFLLSNFHFPITEKWSGELELDLRSERGFAGGLNSHYSFGEGDRSWGRFLSYYADDTNPDVTSNGSTLNQHSANRYRVSLQQRLYITDDIYANIDVTKMSDALVIQDFLPNEYRVNPQPDNVVSITKLEDNYTATLIARRQLNNFFEMVEREPEFVYDFKRQPIFGPDVFYQGETGVAQLRHNFATGSDFPDYSATRLDTYHELLFPHTYGGWLSIVPRIGIRGTYYSDSGETHLDTQTVTLEELLPATNVEVLTTSTTSTEKLATGGSIVRGVLDGGLEASFKFSREFNNIESRTWGLDGLRHVVQPYTDLSLAYTTHQPDNILQFDQFRPSSQLPIFDFPQYTSVDSISDWSIWQIGVRNRLQTKRDNNTLNWFEMDTFIDVNFQEPDFPGTSYREGRFSNLFNRIRWNPLPWVGFQVDSQIPVTSQGFTEVNTGVFLLVNENLRFDLSHRYISNNPFFENSSVIDAGLYYHINENWGFSMREEYDTTINVLQTQTYQIHRDLSSWVASLGVIIRNNSTGSSSIVGGANEYGLLLTFTLKDLPAISVPINFDPEGQGVGGKNQ